MSLIISPFTYRLEVAPGDPAAFENWRWLVSTLFDIEFYAGNGPASYQMSARGLYFADLAMSRSDNTPTLYDRSRSVLARSGSDRVNLLTYLKSGCVVVIGGREIRVGPGDIVLIDMSRSCRILAPEPDCCLSLIMPRTLLETVLPRVDDHHGQVLRRGQPINSLLMAHLLALEGGAGAMNPVEADAAAQATGTFVASCFSVADGRLDLAADGLAPVTFNEMRRLIDRSLGDPNFGPSRLAAAFGVSRATLFRMFEPYGGVKTYIQSRRLSLALKLLTGRSGADARIGVVAHRVGFASETVFSRLFKERYGVSPRDVRAGVLIGAGIDEISEDDAAFPAMKRYLLGAVTAPG